MADGKDPKKAAIPAWQLKAQDDAPDSGRKQSEEAGASVEAWTEDRNALLEQARAFLEETSVRDTSRQKKIAFLEEKGLHKDEIQKLLDTTSSEASSSSSSSSSSTSDHGVRTIHDSSTPATTDPSETPPSTQPQRKAIPPIVTYPEFLLRPTKPPPLITLSHLSYATYTLATISALTYGASKYLVQPMLDSLNSARHDLSTTALHNLEELNKKLEGSVSQIPAFPTKTGGLHHIDHDDDDEEDDPDPTELFHRDVATQTSPRRSLSTTSTISTSTSSSSSPHPNLTTKEEKAEHRLQKLHNSLSSLLPAPDPTNPIPFQAPSLLTTLSATTAYLDKLQYTSNAYTDYNVLYGAAFSTAPPTLDPGKTKSGGGGGKKGGRREDEEDEAMRFRQEIRAVKGVLLSRRNFPAATVAAAPVGVGTETRTGMGMGSSVR